MNSQASVNPKNDDETSELISHTLKCKKWFIEIDEFDKKERKLLNFGHTRMATLVEQYTMVLGHIINYYPYN